MFWSQYKPIDGFLLVSFLFQQSIRLSHLYGNARLDLWVPKEVVMLYCFSVLLPWHRFYRQIDKTVPSFSCNVIGLRNRKTITGKRLRSLPRHPTEQKRALSEKTCILHIFSSLWKVRRKVLFSIQQSTYNYMGFVDWFFSLIHAAWGWLPEYRSIHFAHLAMPTNEILNFSFHRHWKSDFLRI